jgi:hypothetical protein
MSEEIPAGLDDGGAGLWRALLAQDAALAAANTTANNLKQLIVALRLPDQATGRRPQVQRGSSPVRSSASRDRIRAV